MVSKEIRDRRSVRRGCVHGGCASEAVALVAPLAHAIHGAIGITAERHRQLYTRRLHDWRADFGSERIWNLAIGRALLASGNSTLDFMRTALLPT